MGWKIIQSGRLLPEAIMAKDEKLLNYLAEEQTPILHLYEWEGRCLTYGYFINPLCHLNAEAIQIHQIRMARRPTGGGIIFYFTDFAFSVLIPAKDPRFSVNTLENYAFVNHLVAQIIKQLIGYSNLPELLSKDVRCVDQACRPFCMAKPTQYDIMLNGKKVGGAAQRRTKSGFLHQGSISLAIPRASLLKDLLREETEVIQSMQQYTYSILGDEWTEKELLKVRNELKQLFIGICGQLA